MQLVVSSAKGSNGNGLGAILAFSFAELSARRVRQQGGMKVG